MLQKFPKLFREYRSTLKGYLNDSHSTGLLAARRLGLLALESKLATLDLARMHEEALIFLMKQQAHLRCEEMIQRAGCFFIEAITPLEESHQNANDKSLEIQITLEKLRQRSSELAVASQELKVEIQRRISIEKALEDSKKTASALLQEALLLQEKLRALSRRHFLTQEEDRKTISRELHDVIAQTLTGINLRLASLTLQSSANSSDIQKKSRLHSGSSSNLSMLSIALLAI